MLIKLFILNKEQDAVAMLTNNRCQCIQGNDRYIEPADEAVKRIAFEALEQTLDDTKLKLVRRESTTLVNRGECKVESVATYVYDCDDVDLRDSKYTWVTVSDVLDELCNRGEYMEAAYLNEAYDIVW